MTINTYHIQNILKSYSSQLIKRSVQKRLNKSKSNHVTISSDILKLSSNGKKERIFDKTLNNALAKITKKAK